LAEAVFEASYILRSEESYVKLWRNVEIMKMKKIINNGGPENSVV